MEKKTFEDAQVGDRVWDFIFGWGTIKSIIPNSENPIQVTFDNYNRELRFDLDGKYNLTDINPFLFWDEIKFDIPEKPCKYVTSNPIINEKLKNGDMEVTKLAEKTFEVFKDNINSPRHYKLEGLDIESIDVIFAVVRGINNGVIADCVGNILKYVMRAEKKNGLEDYKKARKYLDWCIEEKGKEDK